MPAAALMAPSFPNGAGSGRQQRAALGAMRLTPIVGELVGRCLRRRQAAGTAPANVASAVPKRTSVQKCFMAARSGGVERRRDDCRQVRLGCLARAEILQLLTESPLSLDARCALAHTRCRMHSRTAETVCGLVAERGAKRVAADRPSDGTMHGKE